MNWPMDGRAVAGNMPANNKYQLCNALKGLCQARPGVLGIRYLGPFYFRYIVFFGQNSGIKYLVFPEF